MLSSIRMRDIIRKRWFLSQVGKAIDCNSMIAGSSPTGTSNYQYYKKMKKSIEMFSAF